MALVADDLMRLSLHLCSWVSIFDLLDESVVPMGSLGDSHIVTSIHIPSIKPTQALWSYKVRQATFCHCSYVVQHYYMRCCRLSLSLHFVISCSILVVMGTS